MIFLYYPSRNISEKAAFIYQELKKENKIIDLKDIFIAATAMVHDLRVLTKNNALLAGKRLDFARAIKPYQKFPIKPTNLFQMVSQKNEPIPTMPTC
jgi:hypothetical protein